MRTRLARALLLVIVTVLAATGAGVEPALPMVRA